MSGSLRVVSVEVRDVLGAKEFAMEPGRIVVLEGSNGSGKTTALAAVQSALAGGNLAKLAHVATDGREAEPEVVLVLEGGGEHYRVEREGERVRVRKRVGDTAGLEDVGKPQAFLRSLFDTSAANPVTFLNASDKDRAQLLLEALPLVMDREGLRAILADVEPSVLRPVPDGLHPLEELSMYRDQLFTARTGVNRDAKAKASSAEQTRRNAPAVVPEDVREQLKTLRAERDQTAALIAASASSVAAEEKRALEAAQAVYAAEEAQVRAAFEAEKQKCMAAHDRHAERLRAEVERKIAASLKDAQDAIENERVAGEALLDAAEATRDAAQTAARKARSDGDELITEARTVLAEKDRAIAQLDAQADQGAKARALHDQAKQFDAEAERLKAEGAALTAAIDQLDAFKRTLASDLPIDGLEIEGRVIRVHGVPYEQLNTAQRVAIAVKVACLRARGSRLPVVFVDGAESLDAEHFEVLKAELAAAGVQAFVGRVADHPLTVTNAA